MARPLVIVTEPLPEEPLAWLCERSEVIRAGAGTPEFDQSIGRAAGLVVRTYTTVDEPLLTRAPGLRVVGRAGVGLDNIDLRACRARGVEVVHTPDANTSAVAEYVFTLLLHRLRPIEPLSEPIPLPEWEARRTTRGAPREFNELTIGIVGFGRIGSRVGRIARAFGARVLFNDLRAIEESHGCEPTGLETLLSASDVVTVHVDGRPSNRNFFDASRFAFLRDDAWFLNTSRGFVIDETALAAWLHTHRCALAMLDVHRTEPIDASHPLLGLPNAELFPHAAAATRSARLRMGWVVRNVWNALTET
ncbi:MAG: 3-phosphoglycerate dehydrogenase [Leptolyngbya sp. PLA3]|nr:MAG: 3-phosphoglycerate dehydrogenase [Cyanobacteria bacterium CYA]MCE7968724.1 3-phosphoglycerate dehydrogenase [Leptolyngbya sp. PL-A3]